jgi:hypothetical protein
LRVKWFYVEATSWAADDELIACWTTEAPGRTGPESMTRLSILWAMWRAGWRLRLRRRYRPETASTFVPPAAPTIRQWARNYVARAHPDAPPPNEEGS